MRITNVPIVTAVDKRGFSLPEVAIAVGIAAVALVSLMGVIPSGLDSIRMAGQITACARLISQVTAEIQSSDWGNYTAASNEWDKLKSTMERRWYFDDQANIIDERDREFDVRLAYVARAVEVPDVGLLPGAKDLPKDMRSIQVEVAATTNRNYSFSDPALYHIQPVIVTRQYSTGTTGG